VTSTLFALLLTPAIAAPLDGAAEVRYAGTLSQVARNGAETPAKKFDVYCLLQPAEAGGRKVAFLVDEGGDGWAWPERYGVIEVDATHRPGAGRRPHLLQTHDGTPNPVALQLPLLDGFAKLKEGAEWTEGKFQYVVLPKKKKVGDYECWQIEASTNFGRAQLLSVDAATGLLVAIDQKLFMGRGDQYALKMQLESIKPVDEAGVAKLKAPLEALVKLQQDLKRAENETKPELSEAQLQMAAAIAGKLEEQAAETPFSRLAAVIAKDVKSQSQRAGDVESLAKKFVGEAAPSFGLKTLGGAEVSPDERKDKVVVLHFYKYHGEPLQEPYGQVGYLDFISNSTKKRKLPVQVYGVAVDERFGDAAQLPAAARQVRKFIETMNLGYPVTSDEGKLLQKFGDPRRVGAKLPLWVVIGADGKIAHYKAGHYEINPDEGLKQLDEVVVSAIRKARAAQKSE
jgi:peroxiredoxin